MNRRITFIAVGFLFAVASSFAQTIKFDMNQLDASLVSMSIEKLQGHEALKIMADTTVKGYDQPTFVRIKNIDLKNGTIEVKVLSHLLKNAPD